MSIYDPDLPFANVYWILGGLPDNPFVESGDPEPDDSQSDGDPAPDEPAPPGQPMPQAPTPAPPGTRHDRRPQQRRCPSGTVPVEEELPVVPEDWDCIVNALLDADMGAPRVTRSSSPDPDAVVIEVGTRNSLWWAQFQTSITRCPSYSGYLTYGDIDAMARATYDATEVTAGDGSVVVVDQAGVASLQPQSFDPDYPSVRVERCR
ncbi:MAG: hypothetical protein K8H88_27245 [Sandaracinaceae bacterium]|nr:hypothetical protein [Sandaracinaceae bacterium]